MNPRELKFLTVAAIAATGLVLAACGGGGSSSGSGQMQMMCPEGQVGTYPDCTPAPDPVADLNAAIAAEQAAREAVEALSVTSTDAEVAEAKMKLAAAQAAVMNLAADHALRTSVGGLATSLQGIETERTMASQDMSVTEALGMASTVVGGLDRAGSTAEQVAAAREAVTAAQTALAAATALTDARKAELRGLIANQDTALKAIEAFRATDEGMLAVAQAAVNAAEMLVDALTDESTPAQAGAAYAALQRAKQALAAAQNLPDNVRKTLSDKIAELERQARGQSSITMALAEATAAVNSLTAASTPADVAAARAKVDAAKTAAEGLEDDDARKMAIAALDTNLSGIEDERRRIAAKPGLDANAMALAASIDSTKIPVSSTNLDTLNDETGEPPLKDTATAKKFAKSTMSIASIDGWMGNAYARTTPAKAKTPTAAAMSRMDDTIVVYNNKGPDEAVGYVNYFAGLSTPRTVTPGTGALVVAKNDDDVITDTITLGGSGGLRKIAATNEDGDELDGTFHGLRGKFTCATGCTITVLLDGKFEVDADDLLTFTPTLDPSDGARPDADQVADLEIMIADPDYMHFGYWKNASMKAGKPVYGVSAFFGGTEASDVGGGNGVQDIESTATYAGPASGLYVRKEVDSSGDPTDLYHGQFTADANLTASFGGNSVALVDQYSIKGKITNFMDGDDAIDPTWSVTLQKAGFAATGDNAFSTDDGCGTNVFCGDTVGDTGMRGSWRGQFFGDVTDDDDATTDADETVYPTGVAGRFDGHFVNGHVLGAFGATKQDDE